MYKVSLVPISAALRLEDALNDILNSVLEELGKLQGFSFALRGMEQEAERPLVIMIMSGGSERKTIDYVADKPGPVVLLAHPFNNSLPAALEIAAYLQGMNRSVALVQTMGNWPQEVQDVLYACIAAKNLQGSRIGRLGYEDETRYPFPGDPVDLIQSNWGPLVVDIPFADLITRYEKYLEHQRAAEVVREILEHSSGSVEPNEEDLHGAAAIYLALQEIVEEHGLDAVALKCFDLLPILKNTACFALAKLNEDGVVAACEGDIISALGMLLLRELTGQPSFLANPSTIDVEAGRISLAHCTVPRSMCSEHVVRSHFESNLGVAFQGTLHNDVYTLFRIGGPTLQDLYAAKTMYVGSGQDDKLCRTQVTLQFAQSEQALQLLRRPLGNHHLVVRGEHLGKLNSFAELILKKEPAHP
ncbi:MAG: hypothetical protein ACOX46_02880 [Limnochordia bacterium]